VTDTVFGEKTKGRRKQAIITFLKKALYCRETALTQKQGKGEKREVRSKGVAGRAEQWGLRRLDGTRDAPEQSAEEKRGSIPRGM